MTEKCDYDLLKSYYASLKKCKPISKEEDYDNQGRYHDTSMERFDHTFNQPISMDGNMQFFLMYVEHGEPDYYPTYTIGN